MRHPPSARLLAQRQHPKSALPARERSPIGQASTSPQWRRRSSGMVQSPDSQRPIKGEPRLTGTCLFCQPSTTTWRTVCLTFCFNVSSLCTLPKPSMFGSALAVAQFIRTVHQCVDFSSHGLRQPGSKHLPAECKHISSVIHVHYFTLPIHF